MNITTKQANDLTQYAIARAVEIGVPMNIAVVDSGANIKSFIRMDNALLGSADIAMKKARTSSLFNIGSGEIGELSQPGGPLFNIEHSNGGLITFAGGVPIKDETGNIIGAIGISGGSVDQDVDVAEAAASMLKRGTKQNNC